MFKKLKDKLAEEVKSSPQKFQQFAQAAQAAVTSASSSISDITNSDLFSIGDNDSQQSRPIRSPNDHKNSTCTFQDVTPVQPGSLQSLQTSTDTMDFHSAHDLSENQRQRRSSNSSFASDVSFRLPSYESPSMYHLQSDMEVSASEAEERSFSSSNVSLDRVTKEQIYAAYKRTQERYTKYRTQYADLARHYKLLERENAKAKSVLVETQDKALRRISELREQCSLEQSAKAHLEKALRVELEEKSLTIDTLNTKIKLLQTNSQDQDLNEKSIISPNNNISAPLITFDSENNQTNDEPSESPTLETTNFSKKVEKLEQLLNKYKDSLKITKEKNAQLTTEIQILSGEIDTKNKEILLLQIASQQLDEAKHKISELNDFNEELQNKINVYDFNKNKEISTLELDLQKAQEKITQLQSKIDVFSKREEEYAISLAENKLSIHKELEGKEAEIKSLKDRLTESKQEIQSFDIVVNDYKNNISKLENECLKLKQEVSELNSTKIKIAELESQVQLLTSKCQALENTKSKADEEYKCLQLQLKQETAEKLAMIDRNTYLENRNTQLTEENAKKSLQINVLDKELLAIKQEKDVTTDKDSYNKEKMIEDINTWKNKCSVLESEILDEREELEKLQSEIEKLLENYEFVRIQNDELNTQVKKLKSSNKILSEKYATIENCKIACIKISDQINTLKRIVSLASEESKSLKEFNNSCICKLREQLDGILEHNIVLDKQISSQNEIHKIEMQSLSEKLHVLKQENDRLKLETKVHDLQRKELDSKSQQTVNEYDETVSHLKSLNKQNEELEDQLRESQTRCLELQKLVSQNQNEQTFLKQQIADLTNTINRSEDHDAELKKDNQKLREQLQVSQSKCAELQDTVNHNNDKQDILNKNIAAMTAKINTIESNIESLQIEKQVVCKKFEESYAKCEILQDIINSNNNEQSISNDQINELELGIECIKNEKQILAKELEESQAKCEILQDIINRNNNEQITLKEKLSKLEPENNLQKEEITRLNQNLEANNKLLKDLKSTEGALLNSEKLQIKISELTQENLSLRKQSEEIAFNIKSLEDELQEVRKSHAEIEVEKNNLNTIIDQLEKNELEKVPKDTQTDNITEKTFDQVKLLDELTQNLDSNENGSLKEENRRLQSDISGLQTYLAKISKENSVLNDKLRELIAFSENSQDSVNITELKSHSERERLDALIRENNLLIEENLELKDQLNSQHYANHESMKNHEDGKESEYLTLKEKYTSLLDINNRLEKRMHDLEQMNKSVNGSMSQVQQQNEKLSLTNEKLERRLDEALVSLRHLHSLQENTELEYLRNILYEYLTGTGAHSVTLAKVIAAVVKFDKTQTDQVLQKEKERQGFLRQLGLL